METGKHHKSGMIVFSHQERAIKCVEKGHSPARESRKWAVQGVKHGDEHMLEFYGSFIEAGQKWAEDSRTKKNT